MLLPQHSFERQAKCANDNVKINRKQLELVVRQMPKHGASKQFSTAEFLGPSIDSANDGFENIGPVVDVPDITPVPSAQALSILFSSFLQQNQRLCK